MRPKQPEVVIPMDDQKTTELEVENQAQNETGENVITLIDSIPHRNGNETRIKAMLRGEA